MPTLELTDQQVVELLKQLPPERKWEALLTLAADAQAGRDRRMQFAEEHIRRLCAERNLNWDNMSQTQREEFIDDLVHEDRPCGRK